ncbi:ubiquitin-like protein ATG12 [Centruroides sculpturatus]|uniref:ubiquitin-like protein ATG12 n=1 Tax=Centruroides sculpturatus TaxID=218467 RepID=UPI000C6DA20F|nr:ubiquitin-like protein ATG12 [Centruroides sculpturatus]
MMADQENEETEPNEVEENTSPVENGNKEQKDKQANISTDKINILLKATADAPIMKKKKWAVESTHKIGWIIEFIRRYLKLDESESLFLYVNQAFAPSPDQEVRNIYECFGSDGKLVLHYAKTQAWG